MQPTIRFIQRRTLIGLTKERCLFARCLQLQMENTMTNSFRPASFYLTFRPFTAALLFLLFLSMSRSAYGQWTTNGNDISNTNSGNVGVGTTTPTALLEVKKNQNAATSISVDNPYTTSGHLAFSALILKQGGVSRLQIASVNDNHSFLTAGTAQFWNFANAPIVLATNSAERMRITSTGSVGIGTTAPLYSLDVNG